MTFADDKDPSYKAHLHNPKTLTVCFRFVFLYIKCHGLEKFRRDKEEIRLVLKLSADLAKHPYTKILWDNAALKDNRNMLLIAWGIGKPCLSCCNVHPSNGVGCLTVSEDRLKEILGVNVGVCSCGITGLDSHSAIMKHLTEDNAHSIEKLFLLGAGKFL